MEEIWSQSDSKRGRRSEKRLATSLGVKRPDGKQNNADEDEDDDEDEDVDVFFFFFFEPSLRIIDSSEREMWMGVFLGREEEGGRGGRG